MLSDAWSFFFGQPVFLWIEELSGGKTTGECCIRGSPHDENLWRELHTCDLKKFSDETRSEAVPAVLH